MRGHSNLNEGMKADRKKSLSIRQKASQVLDHLNKIAEIEQPTNLSDSAATALEKLEKYSEKMDSKDIFKQHDIQRRGYVTYKDFANLLMTANAGIKERDVTTLAEKMDKRNVGLLDYKNIFSALKELNKIEEQCKQTEEKLPSEESKEMVLAQSTTMSHTESHNPVPHVADPVFQEKSTILAQSTTMSHTENHNSVTHVADPVFQEKSTSANHSQPSTEHLEHNLDHPHFGRRHFKKNIVTDETMQVIDPDHHLKRHLSDSNSESTNHDITSKIKHNHEPYAHNLAESGDWMHPDKMTTSRDFEAEQFYPSLRLFPTSNTVLKSNINNDFTVSHNFRSLKKAVEKQPVGDSLSSGRTSRRMVGDSMCKTFTDSAKGMISDEPVPESIPKRRIARSVPPTSSRSFSLAHDEFKSNEIPEEVIVIEKNKDEGKSAMIHPKNYDVKNLESGMVLQLGGSVKAIRHQLNRAASQSGYVNVNELHTAFYKAGLTMSSDEISEVFKHNSEKSGSFKGDFGTTGGKLMNVDSFISKIGEIAMSPKLELGDFVTKEMATEERRVTKKVLHATGKLPDPVKFFKQIDTYQRGWLYPNQLKKGLDHAGVPVNETEFKLLMHRLDTNHEGKINIRQFDKVLREIALKGESNIDKYSHPNTHATFRSADIMYKSLQPHYDGVHSSEEIKMDDLKWSKFKSTLRTNKDKIFEKIFDSKSNRTISIPEFKTRLADCGVQLGSEDTTNLENHIIDYHISNKSSGIDLIAPSIDLKSFCEMMDIPVVSSTVSKEGIKLLDPYDIAKDGGVFCNASKSASGNPTYASTLLEVDPMVVPGFGVKKKVTHRKNNLEATSSAILDLTKANEIDIFTYGCNPLPSWRHNDSDSVSKYYILNHTRRHEFRDRNTKSNIFFQGQEEGIEERGRDTNRGNSKRSSSAPPKSNSTEQNLVIGRVEDATIQTFANSTLQNFVKRGCIVKSEESSTRGLDASNMTTGHRLNLSGGSVHPTTILSSSTSTSTNRASFKRTVTGSHNHDTSNMLSHA